MEIEVKFKFKSVLNLEIWHDYFLGQIDNISSLPAGYDVTDAVSLIPTQECEKTLRNLRWLFRPQPYGAVLLAHVDTKAEGLTPIVSIDKDVRLTFWLVVNDINFANYTNLPLRAPRNRIYYFSNLSHNSQEVVNPSANQDSTDKETGLFLTQPLQKYSSKDRYALGDIITYGQGSNMHTLEAAAYLPEPHLTAQEVKNLASDVDLSNGTPSSTAQKWLPLPNSQYVSKRDQFARQGLACTANLVRANPGDTVRLVNQNGREAILFQVPDTHPPETDLTVTLNLVSEFPGYYQLLHNEVKVGEDFVLIDPIAGQRAFALVELSLDPSAVSDPFRLLEHVGETQQLHPKTYRIRFRNRATRWRYHVARAPKSRGSQERKSTDTLSKYFQQLPDYFEYNIDQEQSVGKRKFTLTTKSPFGHYRSPPKLLADGDSQHLPAPGPDTIPIVEFEPDSSRNIRAIFSDIYL